MPRLGRLKDHGPDKLTFSVRSGAAGIIQPESGAQ